MKMNTIIRWPLALAITATAVLSGCATQPGTQYGYYNERDIRTSDATVVRRVRVEQGPAYGPRYRSVEPVAERIIIRESARPARTTVRPIYGGWRQEAVVPYGPNSPVSPSQWF